MLIFKLKCVYDYLILGEARHGERRIGGAEAIRDKQHNDEIFMFI